MKKNPWLLYAFTTTIFFGLWGAVIDAPEKAGFPETLIYVVWSITMIFPATFALWRAKWKLDFNKKAVFYGCIIGFTGAGGQLILFTGAIEHGPAYLIFPIISLSPVVTILLALIILRERASKLGWVGIILALIAIPFLSYEKSGDASTDYMWLVYALMVFLAWGIQAYFIRVANKSMRAESIFFYMTITGLMLSPIALWMTDFSVEINYGFKGPYLAALIQVLNAIGALTIVYAFRYGKAIIVSPLTNAVAPVLTVIISLIIYNVFPQTVILIGMIIAVVSTVILSFEEGS
jgi:uncharacterized membrane protein